MTRGGEWQKKKIIEVKEKSAACLLASGILLAYISLFLPPPGEIHETVIYVFAQILIYAGSIFGIEHYINEKLKK